MTTNVDPLDDQRKLIDACLRLGVHFWWQGPGTFLISGKGLVAVLNEVTSAGERVIGLEGFELESTMISPRLDLIYDADTAERGGAIAVASEWGEDIWVDVVLGSDLPGR